MSLMETDPEIQLPIPSPLVPEPKELKIRSFGMTHPGQVRRSNQDHFLIAELSRRLTIHHTSLAQPQSNWVSQRGHVFVVADGMGGHVGGEVASSLSLVSLETFLLTTLRRFFNLRGNEEQTVLREFEAALAAADARLFEESEEHPELMGMGTTLTLAFVTRQTLFVAHAGDSRCYLLHSGGLLQQVTTDHTVVAEMVRLGILSTEEAARHNARHVITNVLGGNEPGVRVEMHKLALMPGDLLLLCSDGLSGMVPPEKLASILRAQLAPELMCQQLVAEANACGGQDNITAIVAAFDAV